VLTVMSMKKGYYDEVMIGENLLQIGKRASWWVARRQSGHVFAVERRAGRFGKAGGHTTAKAMEIRNFEFEVKSSQKWLVRRSRGSA
jgi:hypothetical protein